MRCQRLAIDAFRNLSTQEIHFSEGINYIVGKNGAGKTSLIEAIHFAGYLKSFRTTNSSDLINKDRESGYLDLTFVHRMGESIIKIVLQNRKRTVFIDGERINALKNAIGRFKVITLTPEDSRLLDGPKKVRRSVLDELGVMIEPDFAQVLLEYAKTVKNRNLILKEDPQDALLDATEMTMARLADEIVEKRSFLAQTIAEELKKKVKELFNEDLGVDIKYRPAIDGGVERFMQKWQENRDKDKIVGYTRLGPHTDDVVITFRKLPVGQMASRGQKKALIFALRISQADIIERMTKAIPVLLLDDLGGDLDNNLLKSVMDMLKSRKNQSFITSVSKPIGELEGKVFWVDNGKVEVL